MDNRRVADIGRESDLAFPRLCAKTLKPGVGLPAAYRKQNGHCYCATTPSGAVSSEKAAANSARV